MRLTVWVKTNSKKEGVELRPDGSYVVRVHASPVDGKANERAQELLADFLEKPKSTLRLVAGAKSKQKIFEI